MKPHVSEYPAYYHHYIEALGAADVRHVFTEQVECLTRLMSKMTEEDAQFRYAEGKWSVKQVIGRLVDR